MALNGVSSRRFFFLEVSKSEASHNRFSFRGMEALPEFDRISRPPMLWNCLALGRPVRFGQVLAGMASRRLGLRRGARRGHAVIERALALTRSYGAAVALAEPGGFVCRASAGGIAPPIGTRLDSKSGISGACVRTGHLLRCDDPESDPFVDRDSCHCLGVPLRTLGYGLRGFFDAEGSFFRHPIYKASGRLTVTSVNYHGLKQISRLLTRLGIRHSFYKKYRNTIGVYARASLETYLQRIGFSIRRKRERLELTIRTAKRIRPS